MTDQNHPITPPPELVQQWLGNYFGCIVNGELSDSEKYLATQAARWGYEQRGADIEAKLPSLKKQALSVLDDAYSRLDASVDVLYGQLTDAVYENILYPAFKSIPEENNHD